MLKLVTLKLFHFLITIAQFVFSTFLWLHCILKDVRASAYGGQNVTLYSIRLDARYLTKLPDHLAVVVGEDAVSINDLADLIFWAMALGVSFVSLYDRRGVILRNEGVLRKKLSDKTKEFTEAAGEACRVDVLTLGTEPKETPKNGFHTPFRSKVLLLDEKDGKRWMALRARELCRGVADGHLDPNSINEQTLDRYFQDRLGFPDPSLALNFGPTPALLGYPPWITRLTEILHLPSHKNIAYPDFLSALTKYSNCNQRLGK